MLFKGKMILLFGFLLLLSKPVIASDLTLSLNSKVSVIEDTLVLNDVINKADTSAEIINKYGQLSIGDLVTNGALSPTQILILLAKSGLELDHLKLLTPASKDITIKKDNGLYQALKSEILGYMNAQGQVKYIDLLFDKSIVSEIPYERDDSIKIQSVSKESEQYRVHYSIFQKSTGLNRHIETIINLVKGTPVILAKKTINPGEIVTIDMVEIGNQGLSSDGTYFEDTSFFSGNKIIAKEIIEKGRPVSKSAINYSTTMEKGAIVSLITGSNQFQVRTLGRVKDVLDNGMSVLVENIDSKKEIIGKPVTANEVRVIY